MITLLGTLHSDVASDPERLRNVVSDVEYDHIFTEGMSKGAAVEAVDAEWSQIVSEVERDFPKVDVNLLDPVIGQGREAEYIEHELGTVNNTKVTYLDDQQATEQIIYTLKDKLWHDINGTRLFGGISKEQLEEKLISESAEREDVMGYFRRLRDREVNDFSYTAISNPSRFQDYIRKLSEDFKMNGDQDLMSHLSLEQDSYQQRFLNGVQEHSIDRYDLQEIIAEKRNELKGEEYSQFQDKRDQNWNRQITEYLEENPSDSVLVVCGLGHLLSTGDTLRAQLEEEGQTGQLKVRPFDYNRY